MKTSYALLIGLLLVKVTYVGHAAAIETSTTLSKEAVLKQSPVKGGLLVHLGPENAELLLAFAAEPRFVCHGLTTDPDRRARILQALDDGAAYGRTSVDTLNHSRLPYADNLVRILVVEAASGVPEHEMLRVLCPGGLLYAKSATGWAATYKEWPSAIDEWTHARHGADGNSVSKDEAVGRPSNVRWISAAHYRGVQPRQTQVMVTSAGRLFSVRDTGTNATLTAQDAFSGVKLWEVPYTSYKKPSLRHRDFWNFPALIAWKDTLFITGKALDASSGDERFVLDGNPLVCDNDVVITSMLKAYDAKSGQELWHHPQPGIRPIIGGGNVYFVEGEWPAKGGPLKLVSLDLRTGKVVWQKVFELPAAAVKPDAFDNYSPNSIPNGLLAGMIYHQGTLALEVTRTYIYLFSAKDGAPIRSLRYRNWSPYASGLRALMIDNLLWLPEAQTDFDFGYDINAYSLKDGEKVKSLQLKTPIRQRCRPPLATEQFMFLGGLNSVNLSTGEETVRPIARSLCNFGMVPANGLLYVPPTHCRCYATLKGYVALESLQPGQELVAANTADHLIKGSAYGRQLQATSSADDWPQLRQDAMRRGYSNCELPARVELLWTQKLAGTRASSPVVANDVVVVAASDTHRIQALNAATGEARWEFVAGGGIEGPPTIAGEHVVFGCKDGWVYVLSLMDGSLLWKNMAAPAERLIMVDEKLQSAWPALGPVLIGGNSVTVAAGLHNMAEAGIVVSTFDLSTGKKRWQAQTPHRPLVNPLTSGVYQKVYDKRLGITPTKPAAALLSGWLVGDGGRVQIDRLGAFEINSGKSVVLFDTRVNEANTAKLSSYKNGSRRNDFDRWLLSSEDTDGRLFNASIAPKGSVAIASSKNHWVAVTEDQLILLDKDRKEVFRVALGSEHKAIPHGIAIAGSRVYVSTAAGHVLCFGAPIQ